jgi:hypothetical protein
MQSRMIGNSALDGSDEFITSIGPDVSHSVNLYLESLAQIQVYDVVQKPPVHMVRYGIAPA